MSGHGQTQALVVLLSSLFSGFAFAFAFAFVFVCAGIACSYAVGAGEIDSGRPAVAASASAPHHDGVAQDSDHASSSSAVPPIHTRPEAIQLVTQLLQQALDSESTV